MMIKSLFYQEASEIKHILESCDSKTLIVIDEYARATSNLNGMALFYTLIQHLTDINLLRQTGNSQIL